MGRKTERKEKEMKTFEENIALFQTETPERKTLNKISYGVSA
jgi:hypothetical protein